MLFARRTGLAPMLVGLASACLLGLGAIAISTAEEHTPVAAPSVSELHGVGGGVPASDDHDHHVHVIEAVQADRGACAHANSRAITVSPDAAEGASAAAQARLAMRNCDASRQSTTDAAGGDTQSLRRVETDAAAFRFKQVQAGQPAKYSGCIPLRFAVNTAGETANTGAALRRAIETFEAATGHRVISVTATSERVASGTSQRASYVQGDGYAPILVNWPTSWGPDDDSVAYGGSATKTHPDGSIEYVSGIINLNPSIADEQYLEAILLHEIGHVAGLSHVDNAEQVMFDRVMRERTSYAAGDREGLAALGPDPECVS